MTPKNNLNQLVKYVCLFYDLRETVASPCVTSEGTFFLKHPLKKRFLSSNAETYVKSALLQRGRAGAISEVMTVAEKGEEEV